jgi:GPN-loop GTPase
MSKFGTLVLGPAGAGKSTFCSALLTHLHHSRRSTFYINLDPAADTFTHPPDLDIRDLISLEDAMEEMSLGPNGGLIFCFEFLLQNLDFLSNAIEPLTEEYMIIFDLPGQIELYTHIPLLPSLIRHLSIMGPLNISLCAAYLLEATFVVDKPKFFAGTLSAMSAMMNLELPHINVLSKMDLVKDSMNPKQMRRFTDPDANLLDDDDVYPLNVGGGDPSGTEGVMSGSSFASLNRAVARLISDFSMVSFLQLDVTDEDSVGAILSYIDDAIQFHEAQEVKEPKEFEQDMDDDMGDD